MDETMPEAPSKASPPDVVEDQSQAIQTNPAEAVPAMSAEDRQSAADAMIEQGRADDHAQPDPPEPAEPAPAPSASEPAPAPEPEPLGAVGEWVDYSPGNNQTHPAMITHVDENTGLVSLAVFYKSHIDFIGEVGPEKGSDTKGVEAAEEEG